MQKWYRTLFLLLFTHMFSIIFLPTPPANPNTTPTPLRYGPCRDCHNTTVASRCPPPLFAGFFPADGASTKDPKLLHQYYLYRSCLSRHRPHATFCPRTWKASSRPNRGAPLTLYTRHGSSSDALTTMENHRTSRGGCLCLLIGCLLESRVKD